MTTLPPGSTIGIVGGGQLGRMLAMAAAQLGYRCHVYAPGASSPAGEVSAVVTSAGYDDTDALARFADAVDVVTYEFENIPVAAMRALERHALIRPSIKALEVAQDRIAEKSFVAGLGGRTAPWAAASDRAELDRAITQVGAPAILKTVRMGYDGKGQARILNPADADAAWETIGGRPGILEGFIAFDQEFSVLIARAADGEIRPWAVPENVHHDGILATSTAPAGGRIAEQAAEAIALAGQIATALDYVGVLACEFFATADGPLFNEMAPRVHNSGHWTTEGAVTSQFENHIRAITGLPLGETALTAQRVEMTNLIGHDVDQWPALFAEPAAHVHLYGKGTARPGRKMGHVTRLFSGD